MTNNELKTARLKLGLNQVEMAKTLKTPYRTYQDWESGVNPIPGVCQVAVGLLLKKDEWFMATVFDRVEKKINGRTECVGHNQSGTHTNETS